MAVVGGDPGQAPGFGFSVPLGHVIGWVFDLGGEEFVREHRHVLLEFSESCGVGQLGMIAINPMASFLASA